MRPKKPTAAKRKGEPEGSLSRLPELLAGPALFAALGAGYVTLGALASLDPAIRESNPMIGAAPLSMAVFLFGLLSFCVGIATARHARRLGFVPIAAALFVGIIATANALGVHPFVAVALNFAALLASYLMLRSDAKWEWVFAAGAIIFWLNFVSNGMPALDVSLHAQLLRIVNPVFITDFFLMLYSAAMMHPVKRILWLFLTASLALSTFRLYAGIAVLCWMILEAGAWKKERKAFAWAAVVAASAIALFLFFVYAGHAFMAQSDGAWQLGPLRTLEHRLAFTVSVFDDVVQLSFPWGYTFGGSLSMESTEYACRILYGYDCRITSTTFGEAMLNFGIIGVVAVGWFAGIVLASVRRANYKVYAILLATMIATLDVGINAFILMELAYLGWLAVLLNGNSRKINGNNRPAVFNHPNKSSSEA